MDNTDTMAPVWSATRAFLIVFGSWLVTNGFGGSHLYKMVELAAGGVLVLGPAAWGVWTSIQNRRRKREIATTAVNAGMSLAASGQMLVRGDGSPVPATPAAAHAIVQAFAPGKS